MATSDQDRVTCPSCGKGYRWQSALFGKEVPCKACGASFKIPSQPGPGIAPPPPEDDGLYELASDPDLDTPPPPPAYQPPPSEEPAQEAETPSSAEPAATSQPLAAPKLSPTESIRNAEQPAYVSDDVKAMRREEQRIAAAQAASVKSWRDYKWLIILIAVVILSIGLWLALDRFGDFIDNPTEQSKLDQPYEAYIASFFDQLGNTA